MFLFMIMDFGNCNVFMTTFLSFLARV